MKFTIITDLSRRFSEKLLISLLLEAAQGLTLNFKWLICEYDFGIKKITSSNPSISEVLELASRSNPTRIYWFLHLDRSDGSNYFSATIKFENSKTYFELESESEDYVDRVIYGLSKV